MPPRITLPKSEQSCLRVSNDEGHGFAPLARTAGISLAGMPLQKIAATAAARNPVERRTYWHRQKCRTCCFHKLTCLEPTRKVGCNSTSKKSCALLRLAKRSPQLP